MLKTDSRFIYHFQSEKYLNGFADKYTKVINNSGVYGLRTEFKLPLINFKFILESYAGNKNLEIIKEKGKYIKLILWDKPAEEQFTVAQKRYYKIPKFVQASFIFAQNLYPIGYFDLDLNSIENIFDNFDATARNNTNKFKRNIKQGKYKIEKVNKEIFLEYYKSSTLKKSLQNFFINKIHNFAKIYEEELVFYICTDLESKGVLSGLAYIIDLKTSQSVHFVAFMTRSAKGSSSGYGLINLWLENSKSAGLKYASIGALHEEGQAKSWKGYSHFKMHFRPSILRFMNSYISIEINI